MLNTITQARYTRNRLVCLTMNSLAERLRWALNYSGKKKIDIAKACSITRSAVSFWFSGETQSLEASNLTTTAKLLSVVPHWLATGEGPRTLQLEAHARARSSATADIANTTPAVITGQRVPVLSSVQAGKWREIVDVYAMGGADSYLMACEPVGKHGFALTVEGDSMTPDFQPGDTIFINPELQPNPGDFVVARNHKAEATFKRYRPRGLNAAGIEYFELVPLNENHPTLRSDLTAIEIIGVVVEHRRSLRRA